MRLKALFSFTVLVLLTVAFLSLSTDGEAMAGRESILWSFRYAGNDGLNPDAGVIRDASGNLYGTTVYGGAYNQGAAFKFTAQGNESVLWSFGNGNDGLLPVAGLTMDAEGNLYGVALYGGTYGQGIVFKLDALGNESILCGILVTVATASNRMVA